MKYKIEIDQSEINWEQSSNQTITGRIDNKFWRASFVFGDHWMVLRQHGDNISPEELQTIKLFLEKHTPSYLERVRERKTKLCKVAALTIVGLGAAATILITILKNHKK